MISLVNYVNNKYFNLQRIYGLIKPSHKKFNGPSQRFENLQKELTLIGQEFRVNPMAKNITSCVHVVSDASALKWAIEIKKKGRIKLVMAGPTIVSCPPEYNGLINDPNIDVVLVASEWVANMFIHFSPNLKEKIRVCPGGVDTDYWKKQDEEKDIDFLIYNKSSVSMWPSSAHLSPVREESDVLKEVLKRLDKYKVSVINYGQYKPEEYRALLRRSRWAVFLSRQETQGHALSEAWSCDVPTLVWNRAYWTYKDYRYNHSSSAPYLVKEAGMFFYDISDFDNILPRFIQKSKDKGFSPREYVQRYLSLEKTASAYMNIWNEFIANKNL